MTERERHVNQSLRALDEAHRLGRITREEYRSRRRHLLGTMSESHAVTARNAIVRPVTRQHSVQPDTQGDVLPGLFPPRHTTRKLVVALVAVVLLCALLVYGWLRM
ncbi:hypothetical protein [Dyella mobilis]|uniref:Short C-terminal domain-containing protein n=1 Tax=Dyella mobilis TaxID=1849582 RepID=A0ABS2K9Z5_9GAMM|nr:hypothetical protein [Dyella mobilis]MBM7127974.1 hypothetical protein [Dyella mobilis]GLQ99203.1 hypothetical protein GCM10007863_36230 [Dyella mobilis]